MYDQHAFGEENVSVGIFDFGNENQIIATSMPNTMGLGWAAGRVAEGRMALEDHGNKKCW